MKYNLLPAVSRLYRREPISAIFATVGMTNLSIGLVEGSVSLSIVGMTIAGCALAFRWRATQQKDFSRQIISKQRLLPPAKDRSNPIRLPSKNRSR
jgi:xanthine/uracil/vitamin C permease (AzgA family)